MDYFGARYYGSALGRFTSPDWSEKPEAIPHADLTDPQTFNLYAYVRNRPLNSADIDGHCTVDSENHNALSCAAHYLGVVETQKEQGDYARQSLSQKHGFTINGQTPQDFAKKANNHEAIQGLRAADNYIAAQGMALCGSGVSCGVVVPPLSGEFANFAGPGDGEIINAARSGTALTKADPTHRAVSFVTEDVVKNGTRFWITGNDGKRRLLLQLGNQGLNGSAGRFEIIYDPETKTIIHQMFVRGGSVNGIPIKP